MTSNNIWFTSDSHFGHKGSLNWTRDDGVTKVRPIFNSTEEMDEYMIEKWNSVVKDGDRVYHLGDVTFNPGAYSGIHARLKGRKNLILGNHDEIDNKNPLYLYFKKIRLWRIFKEFGIIATHVPIKEDQFRHAIVNVHGHVHINTLNDPKYYCVCVENHDYTPVHIDQVMQHVNKVKGDVK